MTATRQFLVTIDGPWPNGATPEDCAHDVADLLRGKYWNPGEPVMASVNPLPDLAKDDSDLQTGFRRLSATLRRLDQMNTVCIYSEPVELSRGQIAALVAELSKQHPARTSQEGLPRRCGRAPHGPRSSSPHFEAGTHHSGP